MNCSITAILVVLTIILFRFYSNKQVKDLANKYVLITGCDSGFGHETAVRLHKMGVNVLATCLTKEGEQSLKSVTSESLRTFQLDVTNSQQIKDVFAQVKSIIPSRFGKKYDIGPQCVANLKLDYHLCRIQARTKKFKVFVRESDVNYL